MVTTKGQFKAPKYDDALVSLLTQLGLEGAVTTERVKAKKITEFKNQQKKYALNLQIIEVFVTDIESLLLGNKERNTGIQAVVLSKATTMKQMIINLMTDIVNKFKAMPKLMNYAICLNEYFNIDTDNLNGTLPNNVKIDDTGIPISMNVNSLMGRVAVARQNMKYDSYIAIFIRSFIENIELLFNNLNVEDKNHLLGNMITIISVPTINCVEYSNNKNEKIKYYKDHYFNDNTIEFKFPQILNNDNTLNLTITENKDVYASPLGCINASIYALKSDYKNIHINSSNPFTIISLLLNSTTPKNLLMKDKDITITVVGLFHIALNDIVQKIEVTTLSPSNSMIPNDMNIRQGTIIMLYVITANKFSPLLVKLSENDIYVAWSQLQLIVSGISASHYRKNVALVNRDMDGNVDGIMLFFVFLFLKMNYNTLGGTDNVYDEFLFIDEGKRDLRGAIEIIKNIENNSNYVLLGPRMNDSSSLPPIESFFLITKYIILAYDSLVHESTIDNLVRNPTIGLGVTDYIDKKEDVIKVIPICFGCLPRAVKSEIITEDKDNIPTIIRDSFILIFCDCKV